ncbi:MAG: radical SAM protein, partial [Candidatus Omnitrophica bacterium]|nr:radical SAM protein [Candidatus Omnitrophota bacterium]
KNVFIRCANAGRRIRELSRHRQWSRSSPFKSAILFLTNRCNSHCRACGIWREEPKIDMPLEMVEGLLKSRLIKPGYSCFTLQGGEAILHPQFARIVQLIEKYGFDYILLSNGVDHRKLADFVERLNIKNVQLSLDGRPQTYILARGVGGYDSVIKSIEELKRLKASVSLAYTISPWNCLEDYLHVAEVAKRYSLPLATVIYENAKIFNTDFKEGDFFYDTSRFMPNGLERKLILFYKKWRENSRIPCLSIFDNTCIMPNGDVRLCHCTDLVLGNLSKEPFDSIWSSKKTLATLRQYRLCNKCYGHCHRMYDLALLDKAKFIPRFFLEWLLGTRGIGPIIDELKRNN